MDYKIEDQSPESKNDREIPTEKERLSRLIDPPQSADFKAHDARTAFVPGVVHVVVKEGIDGRRIAKRLQDTEDDADFGANLSVLRNLLKEHRLLRVEATFDFTPPGLKPEENPPRGRERYLTLYFESEQNTRIISEKLTDTALIDRAVPAPTIIPPSSPLGEPLMTPRTIHARPAQWYIPRCNADRGWQLKGPGQFFSGQGVVVADLDWGFRTDHKDFEGRIENRYNSISGDDFVSNDLGHTIYHGTAVLGLLGAGANGVGMSGFAFGSNLWAVQADDGLDHRPAPLFQSWWFAVDYVRRTDSNGRRKVICLEAETGDYCNIESDESINRVIRDAIYEGVVVCVPAGNGDRDAGLSFTGMPIVETGSILVGATKFAEDGANRKAITSNWGQRVVVSAPGDPTDDISCGSEHDLHYRNFGGTSGATPKVAGAVALMLEANPQLTHAEIRDILNATGTQITDPGTKPIGTFLNVHAAICEALRRAGQVCAA